MTVNYEPFAVFQVPDNVRGLLIQAAETWGNKAQSEQCINQALQEADDYPDILVAACRYFYYQDQGSMALQMAQRILANVKLQENLPDDWAHLKPILLNRRQDPSIRLYLNTYAATGFIYAKMNDVEQATNVTEKIQEIDPDDEIGASLLLEFFYVDNLN
jgi:tetratricopeptide (TPR) repeat protein